MLGHSVKCWTHKQNFLLYLLFELLRRHILILGEDTEINSPHDLKKN